MKKTRLALLAGMGIFVVAVAGFRLMRLHDPIYEGKRLSAWTSDLDGYAGPKMDGGRNAIQHLGSEAVPYTIRLLRARDSSLKLWINKMLAKQSWTKFRLTEAAPLHSRGLFACEALGINGRP